MPGGWEQNGPWITVRRPMSSPSGTVNTNICSFPFNVTNIWMLAVSHDLNLVTQTQR